MYRIFKLFVIFNAYHCFRPDRVHDHRLTMIWPYHVLYSPPIPTAIMFLLRKWPYYITSFWFYEWHINWTNICMIIANKKNVFKALRKEIYTYKHAYIFIKCASNVLRVLSSSAQICWQLHFASPAINYHISLVSSFYFYKRFATAISKFVRWTTCWFASQMLA